MLRRIAKRLKYFLAMSKGSLHWHGQDVYFPQRSLVAGQILTSGSWEPEITSVLVAAAKEGTWILDVGANIGASALPILDAHPSARVLSFEPSPNVLPYLLRTIEESDYRDRWIVAPFAVSHEGKSNVEFTQFTSPGGDVYEGLKDTGRSSNGKRIEVATTTIDEAWSKYGRPEVSLIKIDVEGGELGVLQGARSCVKECRPVIVTEWCSKNYPAYGHVAEDLLAFAEEARYLAFIFPELSPVSNRRLLKFQLTTRENFLLLPADSN